MQVSFVEKNEEEEDKTLVYPKKVAEIIQNLDPSFKKNDVCVLVRKKDQGIAVAKYLSENGIEIISSETLLLKNNEKVNFIINLLYVVENPSYKEYKIKANKDLEIKVNVIRKKEENLTVFILDKQKNIIARRENLKEGENKFTFEMDNEDEYILKITNCQPFKLDVQLAQN